ncbi:MAG: DMT family transporter [Firmicutes bacterium]|nr:DMT family transporter [Bacillota bacterium]
MNQTKARFLLSAVFIARGTSFLFSKTLMQNLFPTSVLAVRFLMAFTILACIFHKKLIRCSRASLRGGILLGVLYTVCMFFEMFGLRLIESGVSALIENMAIVLVPVLAAVLSRSLPRAKTMICALVAVVGVGFLSLTQRGGAHSGLGIFLILMAAVTYAICIMTTEKVSRGADPLTVGAVQLGTMGVLSLVVTLALGEFSLPQSGTQWGMMLMLVLVCSCFGFAFQPLGQKYLRAEEAAVLTVLNPFTASIMGILIAGESVGVAKVTGYILILAALVFYNLPEKGKERTRR